MENEDKLSEEQKRVIDLAIEQFERGETIPREVVMAETRRHYPKYFK